MSEKQNPDISRRNAELLAKFAENPLNDEIWEQAYSFAREEATNPGENAITAVAAEDLIGLAQRIRSADPSGRYAITTEEAPNGQQWFNVLQTFSSPQLERAESSVLESIANNEGLFGQALDLGSGTGKSLAKLEAVSEKVIGVDAKPELLQVAATRKRADTELIQADVTELPFADESFDLVSSNGLIGALDRSASKQFYTEVVRVLKPSGVYIDGWYMANEQGYSGPELAGIQKSAQATLADMIVDTVSGKLELADYIGYEEQAELFDELGIREMTYGVEDSESTDGTVSCVRLIVKQ